MKSPLLRFQSSAFAPIAGEEDDTNPGVFGKALAMWLSEQLTVDGFTVGEVFPEDFGWCISIETKSHFLYLACASFDGAWDQWGVFAFAEGGMLARLVGKDRRAESIAKLISAVQRRLSSEPAIHGLREERLS